ncbi:MAG: right-handed parallel beta-helix repeat-containing protein [archaeon]|nr:MAG: right-handed parallel beta-helix repeat-containing protein [archaeon]
MRNKVVFVVAVMFSIFLSVLSMCPQVTASTITVPDDYSTIQAAVDAASGGDTVSVLSGTYNENLIIDKQISLVGEGKETTVIGAGTGHVVRIISNGVEVSGFTVKGSGNIYIGPFEGGDAGIMLDGVMECTISGNTLTQNTVGIFLNASDKNTIESNTVYGHTYDGIYGRYSDSNVIRGNNATSNGGHGGIYLNPENSNNLIEDNLCTHNPDHGIKIQTDSNYNVLRNNVCLYNGDGIFLGDAHYNEITNNICSNSSERPGITLRLSENNTVSNNLIEYNPDHGLDLDFLNFNNTLKNNKCSYNRNGIALRLSSHHNKIINNTCTYNEGAGIEIEHSDYNEITRNTFSMNSDGIKIMMIDSNPDNEWNSIVQWDYAMEKFKDLVEDRVARGIKIESEDSIGNEIHRNIVEGNILFGIVSEIPSDIDATYNWWGDASGPFNPQENPDGKGNEIQGRGEGSVVFEPWLESSSTETEEQKDVEKTETAGKTDGEEGFNVDNTYLIIIAIVILIAILLGYKRFKK